MFATKKTSKDLKEKTRMKRKISVVAATEANLEGANPNREEVAAGQVLRDSIKEEPC